VFRILADAGNFTGIFKELLKRAAGSWAPKYRWVTRCANPASL